MTSKPQRAQGSVHIWRVKRYMKWWSLLI
jgi:hypothetical protein